MPSQLESGRPLRDVMRESWMSRKVDGMFAHLSSRHLQIRLNKVDTAPNRNGGYTVECVHASMWIPCDVRVEFVCMA
jgi:hypothetical protein